MIYYKSINQTLVKGVLQADGTVLAEDGKIESVSTMSYDKDGIPEILIDTRTIDGKGSFARKSIKPYIGMKVTFVVNGKRKEGLKGFNFTIIKDEQVTTTIGSKTLTLHSDFNNIGSRLMVIRKSLEFKQHVIAEEIGISQNYLSQIEHDKKNPTLDLVGKLCKKYNVTLQLISEQEVKI